jgi:hypothetical protein
VARQRLHEGELVEIFLRVRRIAVWRIDRGDAHDAAGAVGDDRFNVALLRLAVEARQTESDVLKRRLGEDCDAVESLLPVDSDVISGVFDFECGKT